MSERRLETPVAFIIFNRPETTRRVFAEIAKARPRKLLVIGDGPRSSRAGEEEKVAQTRAVIEQVDWDCDVLTHYSDVNLGCRNRVSSGIDWIFEQVPEAITLEDDCLPHPTFFRFCEELLVRYRDDERISQIGGTNFQFGRNRPQTSYYFSRYSHIWGWASWRRAWKHYDRDVRFWPEMRDEHWLDALLKNPGERRFWMRMFDAVHGGQIDTWDFQWMLACWSQGMMSVIPAVNLISNIGFGADATHTKGANTYAAMEFEQMNFPLRHPRVVLPAMKADAYTAQGMFSDPMRRWVLRKLQAFLRRIG